MTGKKSSDLGRSLVRRHNQLVQQSKEKGVAFRLQNRRVLQSVTDVSDIDAVLENVDEGASIYSASDPSPSLFINMDESSMTDEERKKLRKQEEALHASSLRVPRRPPWNSRMTVEELDANEKQAFLIWRRNLARLEENEKLVLTPFEKNLDIWRQLWRVLERSDLLVMVVDARNPLFYRCPDLEEYAREINEHKKTLLLVNKADLLPISVRQKWAEYFHQHNILYLFWSAKAATATLEGKRLKGYFEEENLNAESSEIDLDTKIYEREELLGRLQAEAELIAAYRRNSHMSAVGPAANSVVVGFVGYPNVGKSSTINALVGEKRTGVTSTPGKTKHFQTLRISDELILCDCPGLVFPSFSISRYEMIACGVLPIDRMTEHRGAVQVVADRVPKHILESVYNIILPKPKAYELQTRPPLASELLRAYCSSRGYVSSRGLPDETRAARQILKDYIDGKLPHFELPPGVTDSDDQIDHNETNETEELLSSSNDDSEGSDLDAEEDKTSVAVDGGSNSLTNVLEDLENFDLSGKMPAKNPAPQKKKNLGKSYKQHKKPQKKKDRTWRVGNDGGDGMPIVRVFQKPAVNLRSVNV